MSEKISSPVIVSLVQITEPMLQYANLPYAVALLQAYAMAYAQNAGRYLFPELFFERKPIKEALARLSMSHVVGFSLYVWNEQYTLKLSQALKKAYPHVLIVFGGPQVPDQAEDYLRQHPWIDLVCHGEGEAVFLNIIEAFPENNWSEIPSLSWLDPQGLFQNTPRAPRIKNLASIPSPFLNDYFAPLLHNHPDKNWVTAWETNRGCPFSCTYCDWGSATAAKVNRFDLERIKQELVWFAKNKIDLVFCCDANFGILPRDIEIAQAAAEVKAEYDYPKLLYTQSTKNATERVYKIQKILMQAGLNTTVTLALQSLSTDALKAIRRDNISLKTFQDLQYRFQNENVPTYTDILVGLPNESFESFVAGMGQVMAQGQHREIRTWQVFVLPNAELAHPDYRKKYSIETVFLPYVTSYSEVKEPVEGIWEQHEMIVATNTMTREDWQRMTSFNWLTQSLYYSKALQIPIMLLHEIGKIPYQDSLLALLENPLPVETLVLPKLREYFYQRSLEMLSGQPEYTPGKNPKTGKMVWMNTEYFASYHLLTSQRLDDFYQECKQLFSELLNSRKKTLPPGALTESLNLAQALFSNEIHPEYQLEFNNDIWGFYQAVLKGTPPRLELKPHTLIRQKNPQGTYRLDQVLNDT